MRIKVKPTGIIKRYVREHELELETGCTSLRLLEILHIPEELKMVSLVNGKSRPLHEELLAGDEVRLLTLLTGG